MADSETVDRVRGLIRSTGYWRPTPEAVEYLMGLPAGWTLPASQPAETPSSPPWPNTSAA